MAKYSRHLCDLRTLTSNLTAALEVETEETNITTLNEKLNILSECYANTSVLLDQFCVLLQSCPEKTLNDACEPEFDSVLSDSAITRCYKKSEDWNNLYKSIKSIITKVSKQKNNLNKLKNVPNKFGHKIDNVPTLSQTHIDVTNEAKENLDSISVKLNEIKEEYQFKLKAIVGNDFIPQHPLLRSLNDLEAYLKETTYQIYQLDKPIDVNMEDNGEELIKEAEDMTATMLLIIQSLYKKHLPVDKSMDNADVLNAIDEIIDEKEPEEPKEMLDDNHLKERLQENLSSDVKLLQLDALINKVHTLLIDYVRYVATATKTDDVKMAVGRVIPILEQALLFIQYFVSQKVAVHRVSCKMLSVLLKIFSDLATKG